MNQKIGLFYSVLVLCLSSVFVKPSQGQIEKKVTPVNSNISEKTEGDACELCQTGIVLKKSDFNSFSLEYLKITQSNYSSSASVNKLIERAMELKRERSTGKCYRFVKKALISAGLISKYLEGSRAKGAGQELQQLGFINLLSEFDFKKSIYNPYQAPKGAILVYDGGRSGHIEIKTTPIGEGGFVSDYFNKIARTGEKENGIEGLGRRLMGVYIKPEVSSK